MGEGSEGRAAGAQNPSLEAEEEARRVKEELADDLNGDPAEEEDGEEEMVVEEDEMVITSDDEDDGFVPRTLEEALVPRVGTVFDSVDEAFALYKAYAYRTGFHAVRRTCHNYEGLRYRSTFTCTHGSKPRAGAAPSDSPGARYPLRNKLGAAAQEKKARRGATERTGCKAMLIIHDKRVDDRWKVESVDLEHNHPCTPDMVRFLKAYREMPESVKKKAKITNEMDEMVEKSLSEIAETRKFPTRPKRGAGGGAGVGSQRFCRIESFVQRFVEDDLIALKKFIETMQRKKPNFIHSWDLDQESRVKNFFWTDSRAQAQYRYFGDVITLDVMYLQHSRASLPLATLLGVNNHGHLVLLGCGLLSSDSKENYVWLLKRWLSYINGKSPEAITTSYSDVIAEAVAEVFPNVRHRFCFWNILKKLLENVGRTHEKEAISSRFKEVVYDSVTLTDFEKEWGAMVDQYKLKDHEWFCALYSCRKQWAPGYVNHSFWAGTSAIRKVEKPDPYFDGVVTTKTTLPVFLEQYEATLKGKLEREAYDDLRSYYSRLTLLSGLPFEEQLLELYTVTMFQAFQDEIKQLMHAICKEVDRSGNSITYMVSELIQGKKVDYTVVYNNSDKDVWCICRSFPSRGILCSHALAVLKQENVLMLPSKYILNRWRKDFRILHSSANANYAESDRTLGIYDDLYSRGHEYFEDIIDIGAREPELKEFVLSAMKEARDRLIRPDHTQQGDQRVDVNMSVTGQVSTDTRVDVNMTSNTSALFQGDRRVGTDMTSNTSALVHGDTMRSNTTALIHGDRRVELKMPAAHLIHGEGRIDMNMASPHLMQRERRVDMNMTSPHLIQGDRRVDMNLASPHFIHSDRRVDMNMASPHLIQGDRRVDMNMASPHLIQGDARVDMNMVSTAQNGVHNFDLVNVNMESGSLPMAAADFMQMHPHPPVYHPKQLLDMRDQVMDANKRPNMDTNTYFMGGSMHVG
ncbi:protein FAR1-RELATED SEQUENCE 6-like [Phragmites australis]|uniref:protein FAR1-RELATED SEQUENCE 6-like n=1 Tax=Phragmites australis TaxID=29695 RepID=UPI002D7A1D71|nr:protein FAR1-RELATED SEQUENCE 6-like [Phragmites australis]